jgi:hypothetical protein
MKSMLHQPVDRVSTRVNSSIPPNRAGMACIWYTKTPVFVPVRGGGSSSEEGVRPQLTLPPSCNILSLIVFHFIRWQLTLTRSTSTATPPPVVQSCVPSYFILLFAGN